MLYLVPWSLFEIEQKACIKIGYICLLFLPMKNEYHTLVDKKRLRKVVMLFLTISKRYYFVAVHTSP